MGIVWERSKELNPKREQKEGPFGSSTVITSRLYGEQHAFIMIPKPPLG